MRLNTPHVTLALLVMLTLPAVTAEVIGTRDYCEDPTIDWPIHNYGYGGAGVTMTSAIDGNLADDCNGDGIPGDYDGHSEFSYGGAILTVTYGDPLCAIEPPHHTSDIEVRDGTLGAVGFWVGSDRDCDGIMDEAISCTLSCAPPFPPGADGAYYVFINLGTSGQVFNTGGYGEGILLGVGTGLPKLGSTESVPHVHSCPDGALDHLPG